MHSAREGRILMHYQNYALWEGILGGACHLVLPKSDAYEKYTLWDHALWAGVLYCDADFSLGCPQAGAPIFPPYNSIKGCNNSAVFWPADIDNWIGLRQPSEGEKEPFWIGCLRRFGIRFTFRRQFPLNCPFYRASKKLSSMHVLSILHSYYSGSEGVSRDAQIFTALAVQIRFGFRSRVVWLQYPGSDYGVVII